jgi:hypothetical protein
MNYHEEEKEAFSESLPDGEDDDTSVPFLSHVDSAEDSWKTPAPPRAPARQNELAYFFKDSTGTPQRKSTRSPQRRAPFGQEQEPSGNVAGRPKWWAALQPKGPRPTFVYSLLMSIGVFTLAWSLGRISYALLLTEVSAFEALKRLFFGEYKLGEFGGQSESPFRQAT